MRVIPGVSTAAPRTARWIAIALLIVVAFGTRLYKLGDIPYGHNNDETGMAIDGYVLLETPGYQPLVSHSRESTLPYLYGWLIDRYGFSNAIIRLPSAVLGVAGCLCLCLLVFRIMPPFWAFWISLAAVTYGPYVALDRLALRSSVCTAVVFAFLLVFACLGSSERRWHWFLVGLVFGIGFHTYNAYRVMPLLVAVLLVLHFLDADERRHLGRKLVFFGLGTLVGGANMVYLVLTHSPQHYLWRELDVFSEVSGGEAGLVATCATNLRDLAFILLGGKFPYPVGAEVDYFHFVWLPLFLYGVWVATRTWPRGLEFNILATACVFLLPGLLSTEMLARRILTSLVLFVVLTGIGLYGAVRRMGLEATPWARSAAAVLVVAVTSWTLWSYFVVYAGQPKWKQGPFFAAHRWLGPRLEPQVDPGTRVVFARTVEDVWMLELHLVDDVATSNLEQVFMQLPKRLRWDDLEDLREFCSGDDPVLFLYRLKTPLSVVRSVRRVCRLERHVDLRWPDDVVKEPRNRIIVLAR